MYERDIQCYPTKKFLFWTLDRRPWRRCITSIRVSPWPDYRSEQFLTSNEVLTQILLQICSSQPIFNMFKFEKSKLGLLPLAQADHECDEASEEEEAMLDHQHPENKSRSRSRRIWSSNIPWIFTTVAMSIYIFFVTPSVQKNYAPWSLKEVGMLFPLWKSRESLRLIFEVWARPLMEESINTFTTGLDYNNPNHTLQHTPSEGLRYVGPPSPEIDAAWERIAGSKSCHQNCSSSPQLNFALAQETFLTREEAVASFVEDTYVSPLTNLPVVEWVQRHSCCELIATNDEAL